MFKQILLFILIVGVFAGGIALGARLFSRTIPRDFISIVECKNNCLKQNELFGLLASIGIQNAPKTLPNVVYETDKILVIESQYPYPPEKIHYIVVPKKDIKNIGELTDDDKEYIEQSYAVIGKIVRDNNYTKYKVLTNGPGFQDVAYLHFHLIIDRKQP